MKTLIFSISVVVLVVFVVFGLSQALVAPAGAATVSGKNIERVSHDNEKFIDLDKVQDGTTLCYMALKTDSSFEQLSISCLKTDNSR